MDVRIAYASETGRAEALAWRCRSWLRLRNVPTGDPVPLDALTTESTTTIIFAATAGDGAPPSNAKKFWSALLRKGAPRLDGKRYALYGLGDARYGALRLSPAELEGIPLPPRARDAGGVGGGEGESDDNDGDNDGDGDNSDRGGDSNSDDGAGPIPVIMLAALELNFDHPVTGVPVDVQIPEPRWFEDYRQLHCVGRSSESAPPGGGAS